LTPTATTSVDPAKPVKVYTDHRNLEYFMTTKQLTVNFKIKYRPGKEGQKVETGLSDSSLARPLKDD
jgi:hypothetical protein